MSAEQFLTENGKKFSDLIFIQPERTSNLIGFYVPEQTISMREMNLIPTEPIHPPVFEETYAELSIATYNGTVEPPRMGDRVYKNATGTWTFRYQLDGYVHSPWDGFNSLHGHAVHHSIGGGMDVPNEESKALYPGWHGHNWTMANDLARLYRFLQGKDELQCKINIDGVTTTQNYTGRFVVKSLNATASGETTVTIGYDIDPPEGWGM